MVAFKKTKIFLVLFFVLTSLPSHTKAQLWSLKDTKNNWLSFSLGTIAGIAVHELGHITVAELTGHDVEYEGATIVYPDIEPEGKDRLRLASAGFQAQWILSESLLRIHEQKEEPMGGFSAGAVASHIFISAAYLTFLYDHEDGDLVGISEATGWSKEAVAAWLALPAMMDTWRLMGSSVPKWVPMVSIMSKGIGIAVVWSF